MDIAASEAARYSHVHKKPGALLRAFHLSISVRRSLARDATQPDTEGHEPKICAALSGLGPEIACGDLIEVTWRQTGLMLVDQVAPRKQKVTELRE
jgi:hypothetical protein